MTPANKECALILAWLERLAARQPKGSTGRNRASFLRALAYEIEHGAHREKPT